MSEILVIGHRNPDTDAICSAIGYADFKQRTGCRNVVPARCGELNDRIEFVLRAFGLPAPRFVADVSPRVRDVMQANVLSVPPRTTVVEALAMMDARNIRVLPVLDAERRCLGLLSVFKASKFFFPSPNRIFDSRRVLASVRSLGRALSGKLLCGFEPDREEDLTMMIGTMKPASFAARLHSYLPEKLIVIVGDRDDIQRLAVEGRARVIVITGGYDISPEIRLMAQQNEVSIILSPHDSTTTAMLARSAIAVEHLLREDFLTFGDDELLTDIQAVAAASQFQAFPVNDDQKRVVGILTKSDFLKKPERQLILVDHNELAQAVAGADQLEILEVLDHHRLSPFTTAQPILFRNEPVGSTCTIVADYFFRHGVELVPAIAGCLLAGLVSDTLNLTSPTTTARDAEILARLEKIANIDATQFTEQLFQSGSVLTSRTADQAVTADCKEYTEGGRRFSVAQIEELGFDTFWKRRQELAAALEIYRDSKDYVLAALFVTDVVQQISLLLIAGDPRIQAGIDYPEKEPGVFELTGVVSRKKQLLPYLSQLLRTVT